MASLPVAWIASTIADGGAGSSAPLACTRLGELARLTGALDRNQLVLQVAFHITDTAELVQRV